MGVFSCMCVICLCVFTNHQIRRDLQRACAAMDSDDGMSAFEFMLSDGEDVSADYSFVADEQETTEDTYTATDQCY